jgi:hypothetical protein
LRPEVAVALLLASRHWPARQDRRVAFRRDRARVRLTSHARIAAIIAQPMGGRRGASVDRQGMHDREEARS